MYARALPWAIRQKWVLLGGAAAALVASFILMARGGADFVPRIHEGDIVVTIRRAPSISLAEAKELDLAAEKVLRRFPEVLTSLAMTGRAEVAIDPVGNDNTDIFVHLRPPEEWTTAHDLDDLSEIIKNAIEKEVAGTFVSVSQPIEDKTNELISGSRADVQIAIFGEELERAEEAQRGASPRWYAVFRGAGDVRVERVLGAPELTIKPDRLRLARYGVKAEDALQVVRGRAHRHPGGVHLRRPEALRASAGHAASLAEPCRAGRALRRGFGRHHGAALRGRHHRGVRGTLPGSSREPHPHGARRGQPARARSGVVGRRGARRKWTSR